MYPINVNVHSLNAVLNGQNSPLRSSYNILVCNDTRNV